MRCTQSMWSDLKPSENETAHFKTVSQLWRRAEHRRASSKDCRRSFPLIFAARLRIVNTMSWARQTRYLNEPCFTRCDRSHFSTTNYWGEWVKWKELPVFVDVLSLLFYVIWDVQNLHLNSIVISGQVYITRRPVPHCFHHLNTC